jgi:hypothetical protein
MATTALARWPLHRLGLRLKLFYDEDIFGSTAKLGRLLDSPHDIAMIQVHDRYHYLARTEPILGGRLGLDSSVREMSSLTIEARWHCILALTSSSPG